MPYFGDAPTGYGTPAPDPGSLSAQDQVLLQSGRRWWELPARLWLYTNAPLAATRFAEYSDTGGDYDLPGKNSYGDYEAFLATNFGGDAANFGQPGYETGSDWVSGTNRITPLQMRQDDPYWGAVLPEDTRYYGSQENAQAVAFKQNNPVTSGQYVNAETMRDFGPGYSKFDTPVDPEADRRQRPGYGKIRGY